MTGSAKQSRIAKKDSLFHSKRAVVRMTSAPPERVRVPGQVTSIAWIYVGFGVALFIACIFDAQIGQIRLSVADGYLPALLIVAAIGAILRRPWGRWLCYLFSILMLPGVPLGTIVGGLMIYNLTVHRDQFRRSAPDGQRRA
jgi:hypothetical protein